MRTLRLCLGVVAASVWALGGCAAPENDVDSAEQHVEQGGQDVNSLHCGQPLMDALTNQHVVNVHGLAPKAAIAAVSKANMEALKKEVGKVEGDEKTLFDASKRFPLGNTHRADMTKLRGILTGKRLMSPGVPGSTISVDVTPPQENELYGAFSCIFTAVGPVDGRERYGPVTFRLKAEAARPAWATYSSAYSFMAGLRTFECRVQCQCAIDRTAPPRGESCDGAYVPEGKSPHGTTAKAEDFHAEHLGASSAGDCKAKCTSVVDGSMKTTYHPSAYERVAYGKTLIAPDDWSDWFAYTLVKMLRGKEASERQDLTKRLLAFSHDADDTDEQKRASARVGFRDAVDNAWLGYLEAKYELEVKLPELEEIVVPAGKLAEVQSWAAETDTDGNPTENANNVQGAMRMVKIREAK